MDILREWMTAYTIDLLLGVVLVQLVFIVLVIVNWMRFRKIRRQQKQLLRGLSKDSLEQLLQRYTEKLQTTERQLDEVFIQLNALKDDLSTIKGNVGIVRYNALEEQGSQLSFSLAIVDEHQNGVVISSLYGRHQSYAYAKPLTKGQSEYSLSREEKAAIAEAMGQRETQHV